MELKNFDRAVAIVDRIKSNDSMLYQLTKCGRYKVIIRGMFGGDTYSVELEAGDGEFGQVALDYIEKVKELYQKKNAELLQELETL